MILRIIYHQIFLILAAVSAFAFEPLFDARIVYRVGEYPSSVVAADLDCDGDKDMAVTNYGLYPHLSGTVSILLNNGDGLFQGAVNYSVEENPCSIFAADLNGDGANDLAVANYQSDNISILINNCNGTFQEAVNYPTGGRPSSVIAADFDSDGDNDLAVANYFSDNVSVYKNYGNGIFQMPFNFGVGDSPASVFAADLDNDGDIDLGVANYGDYNQNGNISVLLNNGYGWFQSAVNYDAGYRPNSIFAEDLDGDGNNDLCMTNWYSDNVSVFLNNGNGTFQPAVNYDAGDNPNSIFAKDIDDDNDHDLCTTNMYSDTVTVHFNRRLITGPGPGRYRYSSQTSTAMVTAIWPR
jgi:hypothetical protein